MQIMQTQKADKKAVEKRSNPPHRYQVGQRVMLSSKALTSPGDRGTKWKLRAQYYGPLTVTGIRRDPQGEPAAYQLELPRQWRVHRWFAEEKLKPFYVADSRKWPSLAEEKSHCIRGLPCRSRSTRWPNMRSTTNSSRPSTSCVGGAFSSASEGHFLESAT